MNEYFFLFGIASLWMIFAAIQDLKSTEISNWLNFSLLGIALFYRAIYAIVMDKGEFFWFGLGGALLFTCFAYLLYYGRAFAGGDAKLLIALGAVLPFESLGDYFVLGLIFVFLVFILGAIWGIGWTAVKASKQPRKFKLTFLSELRNLKVISIICGVIALAIFVIAINVDNIFYFAGVAFLLLPIIYAYARAVEKCCFIKLIDPSKLREGDWLMGDVRVGNKLIRKDVHGLDLKDIEFLRKHRKKVLIKEGVPFSPAFVFAFLVFMVFFFSKQNLVQTLQQSFSLLSLFLAF